MDLKLGLNKMAELVAAAALKAYKQIEMASKTDPLKEYAFYEWTEGAGKKVVVKAQSEQDLQEVLQKVKTTNINYTPIY